MYTKKEVIECTIEELAKLIAMLNIYIKLTNQRNEDNSSKIVYKYFRYIITKLNS